MLPLLARTSLAIALGCASLTAQFSTFFRAQDPPTQPTGNGPIAVVRHGNQLLGIDSGGNTLQWSTINSAWSTPMSVPPIAPTSLVTRLNTAWGWDGAGNLIAFNGSAWVAQTWSGTPPTALTEFALAALPNGDVVLFGGVDSAGLVLKDTWILDTSNVWTGPLTFPGSTPTLRKQASMASDDAGNRLILFGGTDGSNDLNDTWAFGNVSGSHLDWTQLAPTGFPSARHDASMVFHPVSQSLVLVGGVSSSTSIGDAWEFVGGNWTPGLHAYTMPGFGTPTGGAALDPVSQEVLVAVSPNQFIIADFYGFRRIGNGCQCDLQPSALTMNPSGQPRLGMPVGMGIIGYTPTNPLLFLAFDVASFSGPGPGLPPGCQQLLSSWLNFVSVPTGPVPATFSFAIPNTFAVIGQHHFLQAVQAPLGFNGCSSNAVELIIGR